MSISPSQPDSPPRRVVRIGCGAGFAGDRLDPAVDLANRGALDFLFFEGLAERTLALNHVARRANPAAGFNGRLGQRIAAVLPGCRAGGTRIVTNMGGANPAGAGEMILALARREGHAGLKIAVVEGDDVTARLEPDMIMEETGERLDTLGRPIVAANAYLGAEALVAALDAGADVVVTGRVADPSLVLAPLIHAFGWSPTDWPRLGAGTLVGHLLECGAQITGGYFADPGYKEVPNPAYIGYPLAEVAEDGTAVVTKLDGSGGCVTPLTVKEQLLYEVHDPAAYLTPDVTADFSAVSVRQIATDRVAVAGAGGRARPQTLKVTIGLDGGFLAETEISYAGAGAVRRAKLAAEILTERLRNLHGIQERLRVDLIGASALHGTALPEAPDAHDVRLRVAMRTADRGFCETLLWEMEALWIAGPAGGGGVRGAITPSVTTRSVLIDRWLVQPRITMLEA